MVGGAVTQLKTMSMGIFALCYMSNITKSRHRSPVASGCLHHFPLNVRSATIHEKSFMDMHVKTKQKSVK